MRRLVSWAGKSGRMLPILEPAHPRQSEASHPVAASKSSSNKHLIGEFDWYRPVHRLKLSAETLTENECAVHMPDRQ